MMDDAERLQWLQNWGCEVQATAFRCHLVWIDPKADMHDTVCIDHDSLLDNLRGAIDQACTTMETQNNKNERSE